MIQPRVSLCRALISMIYTYSRVSIGRIFMKGLISLTFYCLLGCSLSMTQVDLFQDTKQILNNLKQLDLAQLLELQVTISDCDCANLPAGKAISSQGALLPTPVANTANVSPAQH